MNKSLSPSPTRPIDSVSVDVGRAGGSQPPRPPVDNQTDPGRPLQGPGASHRKRAHRRRGDRLGVARQARRSHAWLAVHDHHSEHVADPIVQPQLKPSACQKVQYQSISLRHACSCFERGVASSSIVRTIRPGRRCAAILVGHSRSAQMQHAARRLIVIRRCAR